MPAASVRRHDIIDDRRIVAEFDLLEIFSRGDFRRTIHTHQFQRVTPIAAVDDNYGAVATANEFDPFTQAVRLDVLGERLQFVRPGRCRRRDEFEF
jgi:hypothetical protein